MQYLEQISCYRNYQISSSHSSYTVIVQNLVTCTKCIPKDHTDLQTKHENKCLDDTKHCNMTKKSNKDITGNKIKILIHSVRELKKPNKLTPPNPQKPRQKWTSYLSTCNTLTIFFMPQMTVSSSKINFGILLPIHLTILATLL